MADLTCKTPKRLNILISAYACEPNKGSELGIGWETVCALSKYHETWVITRISNKEEIEKELRKEANENLHFIFYDLPKFMVWWKKHGFSLQLYYFLWTKGVQRMLQTKVDLKSFDIAHHITWGRCWMPCAFYKLNIPYVFGPAGGVEKTPRALLKTLPFSETCKELIRGIAIFGFGLLPSVRRSLRKASLVLATSNEAIAYVSSLGTKNIKLMTNSGISQKDYNTLSSLHVNNNKPIRFISIGRLVAWKGFHLGLRAFAASKVEDAEFWIVGDGKERSRLENLVKQLNIENKVKFFGWIPREKTLELLEQCHALVHTSFHDSGGLVCAEAMAAGRPVICLDTGGPAVQVSTETGFIINTVNQVNIIDAISNAIKKISNDEILRTKQSEAGKKRVKQNLIWESRAEDLSKLYYSIK